MFATNENDAFIRKWPSLTAKKWKTYAFTQKKSLVGLTPALKIEPHKYSRTGFFAGKPRRGMLRRAVFSDFQRKGLEKRFQQQKYISKPDRKKLAEKLGLKDSQVRYFASYCFIYNQRWL